LDRGVFKAKIPQRFFPGDEPFRGGILEGLLPGERITFPHGAQDERKEEHFYAVQSIG
jgi:hypothetical protein